MKKYLLLIFAVLLIHFTQAQPFGSALWFDGVNDYVTANTVTNAFEFEGAMTLEAWIKPEKFDTQDFILTFYAPDYGNRILFGLKSGKLVAVSNDGSSGDVNFIGTNTLPLNVWSHIALTIDINLNVVVYLNGVPEISGFNFTAWPELNGFFCIGQDYDGAVTTDHFNGLIDEVRVWNLARSQAEILGNKDAALSSPTTESNLVAYYTFDNTGSGTLADESVNTNTGTLLFYDGGDGASGTPYEIASVADLVYLSQHSGDWSKYFIQTANIDFGADETAVDWNGDGTADGSGTSGFSPIGSPASAALYFTGNYNGQGYDISYLYISRAESNHIGLFGYIREGNVNNIRLKNVSVTGKNSVGALCGGAYGTGTQILNCSSSGITIGNQFVGGIVGDNRGGPTIQYCFSTAGVAGVALVGGLAGANTADNVKIPNILDSYTQGTVTRLSGSDGRVGAFLGENYTAVVSRCYSVGSVTYSGTTNPLNKGFIGSILSSTESDNFFDSGVSNQTSGNGATAKTTSQMKTASSFTNWDFTAGTGVWEIQSGAYVSYPYLKSITYDTPGATPAVNPIPGLAMAPVTWTGAINSNWNITDNWSPAVVPTTERDATIPSSGITNFPVVTSGTNATVKNLTNNSTTNLIVQTGGKLTISGIYTAVSGSQIKMNGQ